MNWKDVLIPERMKDLPLDKRGYPIPFNVWRDPNGNPHFAINDEGKREKCILENLCSVCGMDLNIYFWFVGGPLSAFDPDGAYMDTALHHECMTYALQVCPYLSMPKYLGRIDDAGVDYSKLPPGTIFMDPTMIPVRPSVFVAVCSVKQKITGPYIKPQRPYLAIEYWHDGKQLDEREGRRILGLI